MSASLASLAALTPLRGAQDAYYDWLARRHLSAAPAAARRPRPDWFYSVRVPAGPTRDALAALQDRIVADNPPLRAFRIAPVKLHLTLVVFAARPDLVPDRLPRPEPPAPDARLVLRGVAGFRKDVLFAEVEPSAALEALKAEAERLHRACADNPQVAAVEPLKFPTSPHVTLFKRSKDRRAARRHRLSPELWDPTAHFGEIAASPIELCKMQQVGDDGFYATATFD